MFCPELTFHKMIIFLSVPLIEIWIPPNMENQTAWQNARYLLRKIIHELDVITFFKERLNEDAYKAELLPYQFECFQGTQNVLNMMKSHGSQGSHHQNSSDNSRNAALSSRASLEDDVMTSFFAFLPSALQFMLMYIGFLIEINIFA